MNKQIILMRTDIGMGPGKMVSQGAHASLGAITGYSLRGEDHWSIPMDDNTKPWLTGAFTKICVECNDVEQMHAIVAKAKERGIPHSTIVDNGQTVFKGVDTLTCAAIGPAPRAVIDEIAGMFGRLRLVK